jgi:uncharacterized membrane protein
MRALLIALACACPIALHLAVVHGNAPLTALVSAAIAVNLGVLAARKAVPWWLLGAAGAAALAIVWSDREIAAGLAFLPPILIYVFVCWVFARTLLPGREPLVTRIARLVRDGELPEPLVEHTRRVTWLWAVVPAVMAAISLALARFADPATWSLFTNVVSYLALGALFLLEYLYRLVRYPAIRHDSPWQVASRLVWRAPEVFR